MIKRAHIKCLIVVIKCLFWISLIYGAILLTTLPGTDNVLEQSINATSKTLPPEIKLNHDTAGSSSTKLCGGMLFPSSIVAKESWQPVDKSKSMYTFSAYFVEGSSTIFIIGVRPRNQVSVICQFWQQKKGSTAEIVEETEAEVRALLDDSGYRFASTIFECFVDWPTPPVYVSLVTRHCDSPTNILQVQSATKETSYERHLTVCLPPLLLHYDKTTDFIKWLEINRQFGVDKFVVYKYSSGSNIDRVLEHYSERGLTEVVQWRPPMVDENFPREIQPVEIENYAQTVALNDCLYRNKKTSEFITNMGLNEYIISPFNNESTIYNMINSLGINAAVYHVTKSILQKRLDKPKLKPKSKVIREKQKEKQKLNLQAVNDKPKLIIRTAEVEFSSMHHVPGVDSYMVPSEKALMHRNSGFGRNQTLVPKFDSVLSWKVINRANKNVENVWNSLKNVRIK